ncbi:MAG: S8 family serine peptidase [Bacteroidia bacterium]
MKKLFVIVFSFIVTCVCVAQKQKYSPNKLIIKFKQAGIQSVVEKGRTPGSLMVTFGVEAIDNFNLKYGCISALAVFPQNKKKEHPVSLQNIYTLTFNKAQNIESIESEYMATGDLEYAHPDFIGSGSGAKGNIIPNDPYFSRNWDLNNDGTFVITGGTPAAVAGADIKMECGWGVTTGDSNVIVAIVDCGCQRSHPELHGRIWKNPSPGSSGYANDLYGWDFAYNDSDVYDSYGHGTNVAGIIGANGDNGIGYAGMNWKCKLMIVKALTDSDYGYTSWWASGVTYATDKGANIINMSLEAENDDSISDPTFQAAVDYAHSQGVLIVACMGNFDNNDPVAPADLTNVMGVGATTTNDWRAVPLGGTNTNALPGSCYNTYISVVAPGDEIYGLSNVLPDSYSWYWFGTSQACPHVVGLASLMLAVNPKLTNDQLRLLIENTADKGTATGDPNDNPVSWNEYYGYGRINACRALDTAVYVAGIQTLSGKTSSVLVYPDPFNNEATLYINEPDNMESNVMVSIYDIQGKQVKIFGASTGKPAKINRDGMNDGMYFYKITSGLNILGDGKFIVLSQ